jgi:hypothetical protein
MKLEIKTNTDGLVRLLKFLESKENIKMHTGRDICYHYCTEYKQEAYLERLTGSQSVESEYDETKFDKPIEKINTIYSIDLSCDGKASSYLLNLIREIDEG